MEFVRDKHYKCRDGKKAICIGKSKYANPMHPFIFERKHHSQWSIITVTLEGRYYGDEDLSHNDIVSEWEDKNAHQINYDDYNKISAQINALEWEICKIKNKLNNED